MFTYSYYLYCQSISETIFSINFNAKQKQKFHFRRVQSYMKWSLCEAHLISKYLLSWRESVKDPSKAFTLNLQNYLQIQRKLLLIFNFSSFIFSIEVWEWKDWGWKETKSNRNIDWVSPEPVELAQNQQGVRTNSCLGPSVYILRNIFVA